MVATLLTSSLGVAAETVTLPPALSSLETALFGFAVALFAEALHTNIRSGKAKSYNSIYILAGIALIGIIWSSFGLGFTLLYCVLDIADRIDRDPVRVGAIVTAVVSLICGGGTSFAVGKISDIKKKRRAEGIDR